MKSLLALSLFALYSPFASGNVHKDIVLKTRFDLESSGAFISQLRIFLKANDFSDPYSMVMTKPVSIDLVEALNEVPIDSRHWINDLQSILQIKLFESSYKINVEKFSYVLEDFSADFQAGRPKPDRVEYVTINYVHGLKLRADKVAFVAELKHTQSRDPIRFSIELIEPEFSVNHHLVPEVTMGWATAIAENGIQLNLESINIQNVMEKVVQNPHLISFSAKDLIVPKTSIKVGHKEIRIPEDKIKRFFSTRQEELKKSILDILDVRLRDRFSNVVKDSGHSILIPRQYTFSGRLNGVFDVQKMNVNNSGIVQLDIDGHYCEDGRTLKIDYCKNQILSTKERRKIPLRDFNKSLREMNRSLVEKRTNLALSLSEHYLNQIIEAVIHAELLEKILKGKDFALGPEKAFVLADEKGELFSLYLDVKYKLKGAQRVLVGRSELRFPIKLMIALKVEDKDGIPHFVINVKKVATDQKLLLEGLPAYQLPTSLNSVRFKKKVVESILNDVKSFEGENLVSLKISRLRGTYLDQMEFSSDGLGRGTAILRFK